jgi:anti-sigma factor RsiW
MNHKSIEQLLSAFVDNELDETGMNSVRAHIEGCASCQNRVKVMRSIRMKIRDAATIELPDNFIYSVHGAIRRDDQESVVWLGTERFARNVFVALCLIVFAVVAYSSFLEPQPPVGVSLYFSGEASDSAAHAVLGSQQELSKEDVMMAALTK